ncbi:VOC family protein [Staphylococcus pseudoxylosus]|uniref:VOC family protein n=1 Tax=Staphylococcus pseudoxylosus TaxID=2282419 RepID=UPI00298ED9CC|nr:VOC family protein [Staphylococcus pseudoxylosus]MDW8545212.1 glyoxalase [Staphylococcus pseudoxylosus]
MNIQSSWLNLPVEDLAASETFFSEIGFTIKRNEAVLDKMRGIETLDNKAIMLIERNQFEKVAQVSNIGSHSALVSISVSEAEEVDCLLEQVETSGGEVLQSSTIHEVYYGGLFRDIDGHLFNIIVM